MDLNHPITLLLPIVGILLILGAVWITGGGERVRLDLALLRRRLAEDLPEFAVGEIVIDADAAAGIAANAAGASVAIGFVAGDQVAVRPLTKGEVRHIAVEGERLVIETGDFTHSRFVLHLPGTAGRWAEYVGQLLPEARAA